MVHHNMFDHPGDPAHAGAFGCRQKHRLTLAPPHNNFRILSDSVPVSQGIPGHMVHHNVGNPPSVSGPDPDAPGAVFQNAVTHGHMADISPGFRPDFQC